MNVYENVPIIDTELRDNCYIQRQTSIYFYITSYE